MTAPTNTTKWFLPTRHIGQRVLVYHSVTSTNDIAKDFFDSPGVVVVAREQTAGRGRYGNTWHSPAGTAIYLSVVLDSP